MNKTMLLLVFLILLTGCAEQIEISNESISEAVSYSQNISVEQENKSVQSNQTPTTQSANATQEKTIQSMPEISEKCRSSAIIYGGCHWADMTKNNFELKIISASHEVIKSVWFVIHGKNETKNYERTEDLIPEATRIYNISYNELKREVGDVIKFDILPVETINGTDYACYNQRTSFIPMSHCKLPTIKID